MRQSLTDGTLTRISDIRVGVLLLDDGSVPFIGGFALPAMPLPR